MLGCDQSGAVVEEGSFRNQVSSIETHFSGESRRIALEAGAQSAWISRELQRLGHEVIVANARELKWITGSDTKNDPADARKLTRLARADVKLLAPIEHRSAEQQAQLAVIRARDAILRARTLLINAGNGPVITDNVPAAMPPATTVFPYLAPPNPARDVDDVHGHDHGGHAAGADGAKPDHQHYAFGRHGL